MKSLIYVISSYPKQKIGHFWDWDRKIREALNDANLQHYYINPNARIAQQEDANKFENCISYSETGDSGSFFEMAISIVSESIEIQNHKSIGLIFPFLAQFSESELGEFMVLGKKRNIKISLAGVTMFRDKILMGLPSPERYAFQNLFAKFESRILWVGEEVPESYRSNSYIREIPVYEESIRLKSVRNESLCFYGSLNAYRGITEILLIALFNPKLQIVIKGHGFSANTVWRPIKFRITRFIDWKQNPFFGVLFNISSLLISLLRFLPNVSFSKNPFETDTDLAEAISESQVIFYCAKLPYGSGIITKALASELPLIWIGERGSAFSILKKNFPSGQVKYLEIFIPNRIKKKFNLIMNEASTAAYTRRELMIELSKLKELMQA